MTKKRKNSENVEVRMGGGGFGQVYLVLKSNPYVIKYIDDTNQFANEELFFSHDKILDNVVKSIDFHILKLYICMAYAEQGDLKSLINSSVESEIKFPKKFIIYVLYQFCNGYKNIDQLVKEVSKEKNKNFIHSDLKPGNILLTKFELNEENLQNPEKYPIFLMADFGTSLNSTGLCKGRTRDYSPEYELLYTEKITQEFDVYSIGRIIEDLIYKNKNDYPKKLNVIEKEDQIRDLLRLIDECEKYKPEDRIKIEELFNEINILYNKYFTEHERQIFKDKLIQYRNKIKEIDYPMYLIGEEAKINKKYEIPKQRRIKRILLVKNLYKLIDKIIEKIINKCADILDDFGKNSDIKSQINNEINSIKIEDLKYKLKNIKEECETELGNIIQNEISAKHLSIPYTNFNQFLEENIELKNKTPPSVTMDELLKFLEKLKKFLRKTKTYKKFGENIYYSDNLKHKNKKYIAYHKWSKNDNKVEYFGYYKKGQKQGMGICLFDGNIYIGNFKNNERDGFGILEKNGGIYFGYFTKGKKNGYTEYLGGNFFKGYVINNELLNNKNGYGKFIYTKVINYDFESINSLSVQTDYYLGFFYKAVHFGFGILNFVFKNIEYKLFCRNDILPKGKGVLLITDKSLNKSVYFSGTIEGYEFNGEGEVFYETRKISCKFSRNLAEINGEKVCLFGLKSIVKVEENDINFDIDENLFH